MIDRDVEPGQNARAALARLPPPPPRRLARLAQVAPWILGFAAYWITYTGAVRLAMPAMSWFETLRGTTLTLLPETCLAPAVLAMTRRLQRRRLPVGQLLWRHLAAGLVFVALSLAGTLIGFTIEGRLTDGTWAWRTPGAVLVWRGLMTVLVYCALCSIGHAMAFAQRVRAETARAARAETLAAEARLAALRAQLNPHFILNLLHSVMGLVGRDPASASAALERLGDVLRYALRVERLGRDGIDEVPLRDELAFVEDYLSLERLRLGDRLRVTIETDPAILDTVVPAFVLQPLVENAVKHAIATRAEGGRLSIAARAADGGLRIQVEDDGPGASAPTGPPDRDGGLGLRLIRERLAALYGEAAWLRIGVAPGGGFSVEAAIPRRGSGEAEIPLRGIGETEIPLRGIGETEIPLGGIGEDNARLEPGRQSSQRPQDTEP